MKGRIYIFVLAVILSAFGHAAAQDATPTPTPTPTPSTAATPTVPDVQPVAPENLKGVPTIAPSFQSNDRTLPDLGRIGVDLADQRTMTLQDAIAMALENNRDLV